MSETVESRTRWYVPTPGKLAAALLVVELCFLLADRLELFGLKRGSGWNVLIAVGIFLCTVLAGLIWLFVCLLLRRRFQFGIKTLFLLMFAVVVVGGWFRWRMRQAQWQKEAAETVRKTYGEVLHDYGYEYALPIQSSNVYSSDGEFIGRFEGSVPGESPASAWLRRMLGDDFVADVVEVHMAHDLDNDVVACLRKFPRLKRLHISLTDDLDDDAVACLRKLPRLKRLHISLTEITEGNLKCVRELTNVEALCLYITEDGPLAVEHLLALENIQKLSQVENLDLCVADTAVTTEDIERIEEALPNCTVDAIRMLRVAPPED